MTQEKRSKQLLHYKQQGYRRRKDLEKDGIKIEFLPHAVYYVLFSGLYTLEYSFLCLNEHKHQSVMAEMS